MKLAAITCMLNKEHPIDMLIRFLGWHLYPSLREFSGLSICNVQSYMGHVSLEMPLIPLSFIHK